MANFSLDNSRHIEYTALLPNDRQTPAQKCNKPVAYLKRLLIVAGLALIVSLVCISGGMYKQSKLDNRVIGVLKVPTANTDKAAEELLNADDTLHLIRIDSEPTDVALYILTNETAANHTQQQIKSIINTDITFYNASSPLFKNVVDSLLSNKAYKIQPSSKGVIYLGRPKDISSFRVIAEINVPLTFEVHGTAGTGYSWEIDTNRTSPELVIGPMTQINKVTLPGGSVINRFDVTVTEKYSQALLLLLRYIRPWNPKDNPSYKYVHISCTGK